MTAVLGNKGLKAALVATGWGMLVALGAAAARVLPWMLDPRVPWTVLAPFARSIALLGAEAALLVGAPVGFALASAHLVESGEARVFLLLGEPTHKTLARSAPPIFALALALAVVSLAGGKDASAPGGVVTELVARGRATCALASSPTTEVVPFLSASWLCAPNRAPRLVAQAPVGDTIVTATNATVAGDFRRIVLSDARFSVGSAKIHVEQLILRGLPPWARASTLSPFWRAVLMALSLLVATFAASFFVAEFRVRARFAAFLLGAAGPLGALAALRALERRDAPSAAFAVLPLAALVCVSLAALALRAWRSRTKVALANPDC
ncbi:MAG: hypothetical protein ACRELY_32605 [Polyangiaceae bacterium]